MSERIRVLLRGAAGRMGREVCRSVEEAADLELVARIDLGDDLGQALERCGAEVAVDFTAPEALDAGIPPLIEAGLRVIVGTSGVGERQLETWRSLVERHGGSVLVVPNFSLGMVVMQRLAEQAVASFPDLEILELHHEQKVDSPSGTAQDTALRLAEARKKAGRGPEAPPDDSAFRGGRVAGIPVHSLRLPGVLAQQQILFGGPGELLTLRHDTLSRQAFMPGVCLAIRRIGQLDGLCIGLESCLPGLSGR
ncbi:MAG: 4-hydroxy-tetrahydrodipicolinate reductase [Planctomycetota bacterium]